MVEIDESTCDAGGRQPEAHVVRLLDEFLNRRAAGEALSEETLFASHPEHADELREHLELVRHLQPRQQRIEELLARGVLQPRTDEACRASLDHYSIHGVLGDGGMGVVLDGHDPRLNRRVALKILRPEMACDPIALARFEREARAAGALQHPNVLTVYATAGDRGVHYIVMERIHGPSLAQLIRARGPLPAAAAREIFRQILHGLAAAHEAGLIHRDVKSSNILLDDRGLREPGIEESGLSAAAPSPGPGSLSGSISASHSPFVKLADFGLARMRSSQTQLTLGDSILGTPEYMSPEQARGEEVDQRTDLYSAGVVLYEMLTGRTPFRTETPTATIRRILDEEPMDPRKLNVSVAPALASIALRLLAKQPDERLQSARETLSALAASRPLSAAQPRRNRRVLLALVGVCILGAAVGSVTLWPRWAVTDGAMKHWNGHYYLLVPDYVESWTAARQAASARTFRGHPGKLATIESRTENEFLAREVRMAGPDPYWIGGHRTEPGTSPTDSWVWVTGESFG